MPRYRFTWSNLPAGLLVALGTALDVDEPYDEGLRTYYGARPKPDFVFDAWDVLREQWLADDPETLAWVAEDLRARRVGAVDEHDDLQYLRSLRRSAGMREVVHAYFVSLGESPASDSPAIRSGDPMVRVAAAAATAVAPPPRQHREAAPSEADEPAPGISSPPTAGNNAPAYIYLGDGSVRSFVEQALAGAFGPDTFVVDDDGDFATRVGSTAVFVTPNEEPPSVRIFAPLVTDLPASPELFQAINVANLNLRLGRVAWSNGALILEHTLIGAFLSIEELAIVARAIAGAADDLDTLFQEQFGGTTMFVERARDEIDV